MGLLFIWFGIVHYLSMKVRYESALRPVWVQIKTNIEILIKQYFDVLIS